MAITSEERREICRRAGLARARSFTSESQRAARAAVSRESLVEAGKRGARVTMDRHGLERFWEVSRMKRLANPSAPERALIGYLRDWKDWEPGREYQREHRPAGCGYLTLDFAWPHLKRAIEVNGAVHYIPALNADGRRLKREVERDLLLEQAGWQVMKVTEADLQPVNEEQLRKLVLEFLWSGE